MSSGLSSLTTKRSNHCTDCLTNSSHNEITTTPRQLSSHKRGMHIQVIVQKDEICIHVRLQLSLPILDVQNHRRIQRGVSKRLLDGTLGELPKVTNTLSIETIAPTSVFSSSSSTALLRITALPNPHSFITTTSCFSMRL